MLISQQPLSPPHFDTSCRSPLLQYPIQMSRRLRRSSSSRQAFPTYQRLAMNSIHQGSHVANKM